MTGDLGLKREEAAATANFSGSCSSLKRRSKRTRSLAGAVSLGQSRQRGKEKKGRMVEMVTTGSQKTQVRGVRLLQE